MHAAWPDVEARLSRRAGGRERDAPEDVVLGGLEAVEPERLEHAIRMITPATIVGARSGSRPLT